MLELVRRLFSKPASPAQPSPGLSVRTAVRAGMTSSGTTTTTTNKVKLTSYVGANGIGYVPVSRAFAHLLDAQARRAGRLYARLRRP